MSDAVVGWAGEAGAMMPEVVRQTAWRRDDVRERLAELVADLPDGARLPAERDLADTLLVSRTTVRQATQELVAVGRLARRHGSGTYVCGPKVTFLLEPGVRGTVVGPPEAVLKSCRVRHSSVPAVVTGQLRVPKGVGVLEVGRSWLVGDVPLCVESSYLLDRDSVVVSINGAPEGARSVDTAVEHRAATAAEADELLVRAGTPVFAVNRRYYDDTDNTVSVAVLVCRADRCSLLLRSALPR
ncbi:GntR family transcriptional regulator [Solihabitans fulvus]|uniref:GntR family transcriptional regulator n=1 Tax=Solihabitans fulvus TaxID=1892852 RepID=A0A5B2X4H0_9PSEU|nr:GntR family transcriptional regulator [Solihabitans fulvus]KAA2258146.1 GntR family transcriptional regulator [Solihabitans fulvus]